MVVLICMIYMVDIPKSLKRYCTISKIILSLVASNNDRGA